MTELSTLVASYQWYAGNGEQRMLYWASNAIIGQFLLAALALLSGINAPYGRYNQEAEKSGQSKFVRLLASCDVHPKLAWVLQECPTLLFAAGCWARGRRECKAST